MPRRRTPTCQAAFDSSRHLRDSLPVKTTRITGVVLATLLASSIGLRAPAAERHIYPAPEQAPADLAAALKNAASQHRRVILDFGGDWCTDCQVLDIYLHDSNNAPILDAGFVLVHINIGERDRNLDIAQRYGIPLNKGVPAMAVLDSSGKLLYSQKAGEFEAMRHMESSAVMQFLQRWKPDSGA